MELNGTPNSAQDTDVARVHVNNWDRMKLAERGFWRREGFEPAIQEKVNNAHGDSPANYNKRAIMLLEIDWHSAANRALL